MAIKLSSSTYVFPFYLQPDLSHLSNSYISRSKSIELLFVQLKINSWIEISIHASIVNTERQLGWLQFGLSFYATRHNSNRTWLVLLVRKQCVDMSVELVHRVQRPIGDPGGKGWPILRPDNSVTFQYHDYTSSLPVDNPRSNDYCGTVEMAHVDRLNSSTWRVCACTTYELR